MDSVSETALQHLRCRLLDFTYGSVHAVLGIKLLRSSSRAFCFKKKSGSITAEVPQKVIGANVFANRSVNVLSSREVTKPPMIFPNKPERTPKFNFFTALSKTKTNTINPLSNPFAVSKSAPVQSAIQASTKPDNTPTVNSEYKGIEKFAGNNSFAIPVDDWDDLDDFEMAIEGRASSQTPQIPVTKAPGPEKDTSPKAASTKSADTTENGNLSLGPSFGAPGEVHVALPGPASGELDDSPIKPSKRRLSRDKLKTLLSDSEDESITDISKCKDKTAEISTGQCYSFLSFFYLHGVANMPLF